ncbi:hypothetical protein [Kribbella sp. NPDC048915]|uniref:hypothetical protein n=1 Tax=Kribbella sp. NPDC048915 TaxID=3155148 RepID=UPI0033C528F1
MRRFAPETIPFRRLLDSTRRWTVLLTAAAAVAATLTLTSATATAAPATPDFGAAIDGYAAYDGQDTCDPTIKPGVRGFRSLLNEAYGTHTGYITRECSASGTSEHKEGRALDYMLNINDSGQRAIANDILSWLLATDRYGNKHANARRLGIMYMIWNRQIWKSYQASSGWQPYTGNNPHTDHIHFSFSWKGASKQTTWWTATPIPETPRGMVELAAGELTRDGRSDLLAVEHDTGKLWLYPGRARAARSAAGPRSGPTAGTKCMI